MPYLRHISEFYRRGRVGHCALGRGRTFQNLIQKVPIIDWRDRFIQKEMLQKVKSTREKTGDGEYSNAERISALAKCRSTLTTSA